LQDRLSIVQTEIEQLQGQQRLLDDQTSFGTLVVQLREQGDETALTVPEDPESGLAKAWDDAHHGFMRGVEAIVAGSGTALVTVLSLTILAFMLRGVWLLLRRRLV
jgi:hypothetical protein